MTSLIQPYFVMAAEKYYKTVINDLGISHFYTFPEKAIDDQTMMAVPDGCIDILFNCDADKPFAEVCGSVLTPKKVLTGETARYFGVRFYPGFGYKYNDVKMEDIMNQQLPLNELLDASEMFEKIVTTTDFSSQVSIFSDHYRKFLHKASIKNNPVALKKYLLDRILETKGQIRMKTLSIETGYSSRYINTKFTEFFGISPKIFCKIIRFQNVLNQLNNSDGTRSNLINIANDAGYYDQAHMYKDFKEFADNPPGKYLGLIKELDYYERLIIVENDRIQKPSLIRL